MKTTREFEILDDNLLSTTTGGDFASRYISNLKQDVTDWTHRLKATGSDVKSHRWGSAVKNYFATALDGLGGVGDAIAPIKALT